MAKIGQLKIVDGEQYYSGGAFRLKETPNNNNIVVYNGWEVELEEKNPFAAVRAEKIIPEKNRVDSLYEHLQRGLDILSIENDADHRCENLHSEHIVAWSKESRQFLRLVGIADFSVGSSASATVRDKNGELVKQDIPETKWHESLRFFRLSQSTDDLFDAYRNAFLALETLLSDRTPIRSEDGEGESDWLKRALSEAQKDIDLGKFAPNPSSPVESIHGYQYKSTRCEMFHSKISEPSLVPHRVEDREHVHNALDDLLRIYVTILRDTVDLNREEGVVTYEGFEWMTLGIRDEQSVKVCLSTEESSYERSTSSPSNDYTHVPGTFSEEYSKPGKVCILAETDPSKLDIPSPIHSIKLEKRADGKTISSMELGPGLYIDHIDIFQTLLGLRLDNVNSVKTRFGT